MKDVEFDWDERKDRQNQKKHGVAFDEARTVFYDENALLIPDPEHSDQEERFLMLGYSNRAQALIVSHCYREGDSIIRIISAFKANNQERRQYFQRR